MGTRMRVTGWRVQPVVFKDDGENLEEVEVQAAMVPAAQWEAFKAGGDASALEQVRQQIEKPDAGPGTPAADN
jgi:hypothetical protein